MKKYRSIDLDYGVNTALIEAYRAMQRELELEAEAEDDDENIEELNSVMGADDENAAAEEYAAEIETAGAESDGTISDGWETRDLVYPQYGKIEAIFDSIESDGKYPALFFALGTMLEQPW